MNVYAIIFWIFFILIVAGHVLFIGIKNKNINLFECILLLSINFVFYKLIDGLAIYYGPDLIGYYGAQAIVGATAGWFVIKGLKIILNTQNNFLFSIVFLASWYNYVF